MAITIQYQAEERGDEVIARKMEKIIKKNRGRRGLITPIWGSIITLEG